MVTSLDSKRKFALDVGQAQQASPSLGWVSLRQGGSTAMQRLDMTFAAPGISPQIGCSIVL